MFLLGVARHGSRRPLVGAFSPGRTSRRPNQHVVLRSSDFNSNADALHTDDEGRRIRRARATEANDGGAPSSWKTNTRPDDDVDESNNISSNISSNSGDRSSASSGWDDWDPLATPGDSSPRKYAKSASSSSSSSFARPGRRGSNASSSSFSPRESNSYKDSRSSSYGNTRGSSYGDRAERPSRFGGTRGPSYEDRADRGAVDPLKKINLKALDGAGYDHLYGLAPVRNALEAQRREFVPLENRLFADEADHVAEDPTRRPEAQFRPYLFVQERQQRGGRAGDKALQATQVERLAEERGVPIAYVDKGVLNTLSGNRPHQGYVLRCGKLSWEPITRLPLLDEDDDDDDNAVDDASSSIDSRKASPIWLVLDQIVDPQNLGALLRSAYFLGPVRVLVCAKNSAPPSAVVSASSAGALEDMTVYATHNLPRTLAAAEQDGFRIVGAAAESPEKDNALAEVPVYELSEMPPPTTEQPTLLVLGSEGHGLRPLVASTCTEFVKIPGGAAGNVDSLNVSVTGGILLWQLVSQLMASSSSAAATENEA